MEVLYLHPLAPQMRRYEVGYVYVCVETSRLFQYEPVGVATMV